MWNAFISAYSRKNYFRLRGTTPRKSTPFSTMR